MERHQSRQSLKHFFRAAQAEGDAVVFHLVQCRACWHKAVLVLDDLKGEGDFASSPLGAAVARLIEGEAHHVELSLRAGGAVSALKELAPFERRKRVRGACYLQDQVFVHAILAEVASLWHVDPKTAEDLALLAGEVAAGLPLRRYSETTRTDLRAEVLSHIANSRRLGADFSGARSALAEARALLDRGTGDQNLEAFWLRVSAAVATDIGQFEEALALLERAGRIYRNEGGGEGIATTAVEEGTILLAALRAEEALARADSALMLPGLNERLEMFARSIATEALVVLNRPREAVLRFAETKALYAQFPDCTPRVLYLEARLLDALGDARDAERRFREAASLFLDTECYKEAFLTFLSLFESFLHREAFGKAANLCLEVLGIEQMLTGRPAIRKAWEDLLALARTKTLGAPQMLSLRQYCTRYWSISAPPLSLACAATAAAPHVEASAAKERRVSRAQTAEKEPLLGDAYHEAIEAGERENFSAAFKSCDYSVRGTAHALGMSRMTVRRKAIKYNLLKSSS